MYKDDQPPTDDPTLPSYECEQYQALKMQWEYLADMWEGAKNWYHPLHGIIDPAKAEAYLIKEQAEPSQAYEGRVARSPFHKHFQPTGEGYAGLLSEFDLDEDVPATIETYEDDINLKGDSLKKFLHSCDCAGMKFGYCLVQVDRTRLTDEEGNQIAIEDRATEQAAAGTIRNYLIKIDPRDLINWDSDIEGGKVTITRAIVKERRMEPDPDGEYGRIEKCYYREFLPGEQIVWDIVKQQNQQRKWTAVEVERISDLPPTIPLAIYPDEQETPLENLADMQLELYREMSDESYGRHKVNLATVVRTGAVQPGYEDEASPVVLGWNHYQDLPQGATFGFAEPSGNALSATRDRIHDLEQAMDEAGLQFLGLSGEQPTATQALLDATQAKATITGYAELKESAVQRIFTVWAEWDGQPNEDVGGIAINRNMLQPPLTVPEIEGLVEKGVISNRTAIELINRLGTALDADEEFQRLAQEAIARLRNGRSVAPPNVPPRPAPNTNTVIPNAV